MGTIAVVAHSPSLYVVLDVGHPRTRVLPEEWEPNARLIAAAPDLYAALNRIATHLADRCDSGILDLTPEAKLWELARAALAKAEGRDGT